jgi:hypothetical protein
MRPLSNKQRDFLERVHKSSRLTELQNQMIGWILDNSYYCTKNQAETLNKLGKLYK